MVTKKKTTTAKKRPVKRRAKSTKTRRVVMKSFHLSKSDEPFFTFRVGRQSVYWVIIGVVVIVFTVWILKLQSDIQSIYNSIMQNDTAQMMAPTHSVKKHK